MAEFAALLLALLIVHVLCDVPPLQPAELSAAKRDGIGALALHAGIHGAGAMLALAAFGQPWTAAAIGLTETAAHAAIDYGKCRGRYGLAADQALHGACQVAWALIAVAA